MSKGPLEQFMELSLSLEKPARVCQVIIKIFVNRARQRGGAGRGTNGTILIIIIPQIRIIHTYVGLQSRDYPEYRALYRSELLHESQRPLMPLMIINHHVSVVGITGSPLRKL